MRKAIRVSLPRYIDLFTWLREHGYAQTNGGARQLIAQKRLKAESHTLGLVKVVRFDATNQPIEVEEVERYTPAVVRNTLRVV